MRSTFHFLCKIEMHRLMPQTDVENGKVRDHAKIYYPYITAYITATVQAVVKANYKTKLASKHRS